MKHHPDSLGDALGVHVTWMLTPFVKFNKATSSSLAGAYRVEQKGDSVTFKASADDVYFHSYPANYGEYRLILSQRGRRAIEQNNRSFPSCCEPLYESEAKCKAFHMKISFACI